MLQEAYNLIYKPEKLLNYQTDLFYLSLLGIRSSTLRWSLVGRLDIFFLMLYHLA